jgi:hypothetical protein
MKSKDNAITKNYRGKFANQGVFRVRGGVSFISKIPRKTDNPPSEQQLARRHKFSKAVQYARMVIADPEMTALYAKRVRKGKTVYNLAISDFMKKQAIGELNGVAKSFRH